MKDLLTMARRAFDNAYAPYSDFKVGAALRAPSGTIYRGANVENAAYPLGNCAEASAIAAMIAAGERKIVEAAVVAEGERLCTPCGGCRQRLAEFAGPGLEIHIGSPEGHRQTLTLGELLPHAFELSGSNGDGQMPDDVIDVIRKHAPSAAPRVGLILGSGLGGFADKIENPVVIDYTDLPGFPRPSVEGHGGRLVLGIVGGLSIACLQGRVHLYEGKPASASAVMVRTLRALGCKTLIVTNAAGSLRSNVGPGSLVLIEDHINMLGQNPLTGPNDPSIGPRFPDMTEAYSASSRKKVRAVAAAENISLATGVYLATLGPCFETPAEIRAFKALGADLVGMSTVPEVIAARHAGLDVIGFSIVTNLAAGMSGAPLSHEETLSEAGAAGKKLEQLLTAFFKEMA
ncbi:MAG: purine-nucleoside phosphorylase [Geminicoccaceae bacterium]